jgi:hypothetical protein
MNTKIKRRGLAVGIVAASVVGIAASGAWASDAPATEPLAVTVSIEDTTDATEDTATDARPRLTEEEILARIEAAEPFVECLRENGIDVPEVDLSDGVPARGGLRGMRDVVQADPEAFADAREACADLQPERPEGAGNGQGSGRMGADEDADGRGHGRGNADGARNGEADGDRDGDRDGSCMDDDASEA